ncbi:hypothetical protein [Yeosuana sp. AK3]
MKTATLFFALCFFINSLTFSQVGIGTNLPDASSMLEIESNTKGFLPPRMLESERDLITSPANGLLIYNTSTNELNYFNGASWQVVDTSSGEYIDLTTDQNNILGNKTFKGNLIASGRLMIPMGEISFFDYSGFITSFGSKSNGVGGNDNMTKIDPTLSGTFPSRVKFVNDMFGTGNNSALTYQGNVGRYFHIALSFSYLPGTGNDTYGFGVAKNGLVQDASKIFIRTQSSNTDHQSSAMHVLLWLEPNDYIEFYVGNMDTNSSSIKIKSFNFVAIGM